MAAALGRLRRQLLLSDGRRSDGDRVPPELASFYTSMCPAGVYEREGDALVVRAPNCIDCKTTDVLGPRGLPREGARVRAIDACDPRGDVRRG
jgi:hypothetical protein